MASVTREDDTRSRDAHAPEHTFQSARTRAWIATFGLAVTVAISATITTFDLVTLVWISDWEQRAEAGDTPAAIFAFVYGLVNVAALFAYLFAVVTFLMWLHRASRNAWVLYPVAVRTSPAMAVGCWFIPLVHLFRPYQVVRTLHSAADTDGHALSGDWVARWPSVFTLWWGTWLAYNFFTNIATRQSFSDDQETVERALWMQTFAFPLELIAATCLIVIVWSIQARQEELARREATPEPLRLFPDDDGDRV